MIPERGLALRAPSVPAAGLWLAAALVLPQGVQAQRVMPEPLRPEPPALDFSETRRAPVPIPTAAAPAPAPAKAQQPAQLNTGLVTIESDLQRADQGTGVVTSTGNVRIVYPDQRVVATARQAQYFSKEGRVVLSGDVDIVQEGGNLMRAEQVVYMVTSERLLAIPAAGQQVFSRVRMIQPSPAAAPAASPAAQP